ncbi:MAG: hypothetical protein HGA44_10465 [Cellulomonadaceae bacterium]|nr:hypothetical protein [Cellulomonadaceae bacterium]
MTISTTCTRVPPTVAGLAGPLVVLVGLLLSGCSALGGTVDSNEQPQASAEVTSSADEENGTTAAPRDDADVRVAVGPLLLGTPGYWQVGETTDGATLVVAQGCQEGQPCPGFAVLQAGAIAAGFDGSTPYTQDATGCPGGLAPRATDGRPTVTDVVVDGVEGTLSQVPVDCTDGDGAVQMTVQQVQWYLPDAPGGAVLVVDRWSFEGLSTRVAGAAWSQPAS